MKSETWKLFGGALALAGIFVGLKGDKAEKEERSEELRRDVEFEVNRYCDEMFSSRSMIEEGESQA